MAESLASIPFGLIQSSDESLRIGGTDIPVCEIARLYWGAISPIDEDWKGMNK